MKLTNIQLKGSWKEVLNDCRFTVNKPDLDKEPSDKFKKSILLAEHSPIRDIRIRFDFLDLGTCFITHFVRHKWEKFVATQRTDRTGVDRHSLPQDNPNNMRGELNVQNLIDTSRKRLCFCSSKETREAWEQLIVELRQIDPFIANVCVPNCVYRGGCPEGDKCCGMVEKWLDLDKKDLTDLEKRYTIYQKWLDDKWSKEV